MNEPIKQMLALQDRDLELDRLRAESSGIPAKVEAIKGQIAASKKALEDAKKDLVTLQMAKKQRELDLDTQEGAVRKHTGELNAVKTNEAYKALLGEIEKAKKTQSALEDQILQVMEQIDQAQKAWKEKEASAKGVEADFQKQISDWESKKSALEQDITAKQSQREEAANGVPKAITEQYGRLRANRKGAALVPIRKEQCSGCHMKVSQNLINEVRRGQKIMFCEHCARIVYLEEMLAAPAPGAQAGA